MPVVFSFSTVDKLSNIFNSNKEILPGSFSFIITELQVTKDYLPKVQKLLSSKNFPAILLNLKYE